MASQWTGKPKQTFVQRIGKERVNFLRLTALIIDGGKLALKNQFDLKFPPQTLAQDLRAPGNFQILQRLGHPPRGKRRVLMQEQFDLLFPHLAVPPSTRKVDSSDFDVTLLACLIQNLPAFHEINNPVWTQKGYPSQLDLSLAADVKRLRLNRNEIAHSHTAAEVDFVFKRKWMNISEVIKRLCPSDLGIQSWLDAMEKKSIDPVMEKEYIDEIKKWEWSDINLKRGLAELQDDFGDIKETLDGVIDQIRTSNSETVKLSAVVNKEKKRTDDNAKRIEKSLSLTTKLTEELEKVQAKTRDRIEKNESVTAALSNNYEKEKSRLSHIEEQIKKNVADTSKLSDDLESERTRSLCVEELIIKSMSTTTELSDKLENVKERTNKLVQIQDDNAKRIEKSLSLTTKLTEELEKVQAKTRDRLEKKNESVTAALSNNYEKEKSRLSHIADQIKTNVADTSKLSDDLESERTRSLCVEELIIKYMSTTTELSDKLENVKERTNKLVQIQDDNAKRIEKSLSLTTKSTEELEKVQAKTRDRIEKNESVTAALSNNYEKEKSRLSHIEEQIKKNVADSSKLSDDLESERTRSLCVEELIIKSMSTTTELSDKLENVKERTNKLVQIQENEMAISSELRALASRSKHYFEDIEDCDYKETVTYLRAKEKVDRTKFVIISGHPGEGKTTMAKRLLLSKFTANRCISVRDPGDWEQINLDVVLKHFDAILIDDIFGIGVFEEALFRKWKRRLVDLSSAIRKGLTVVIASRHYILEESKQLLSSVPLFRKENLILLSSKNLSNDEKRGILECHLKAENREFDQMYLDKCVMKHSEFQYSLNDSDRFLFGFPQSARLFAKENGLFGRGADFFLKPYAFFKICIEELYESEESFFALIVLWVSETQTITKSEFDRITFSDQVRIVAERFHFELEGKQMIRHLFKSLDFHAGGLLHFSKETGVYSFSHQVISDMVGLVIAQHNTEEILGFCPRNFLMRFATTESDPDTFEFCIDEYLYEKIALKIATIMCEHISYEGILDCGTSLLQLNKGGKLSSMIVLKFEIDFSVIKHLSFENEKFVNTFLDTLFKYGHLDKILGCEVLVFSGCFLKYGIEMEDQKHFLLACSLFLKAKTFANAIIARDFLRKTKLDKKLIEAEYNMAMLFAVHYHFVDTVSLLLQRIDAVAEEALYIAVHNEDETNIRQLMGRREVYQLNNVWIKNSNNALHISAKKGLFKSVKCLIHCGYDISLTNNAGMTALEKALVNRQERICEILLDAGAALELRSKRFKRTPLHIAVDIGLVQTTKKLLTRGAKVRVKDHRGFFPIHTAALRNHLEIVQIILRHDPSQGNLKAKAYGKKSAMKGMTVVHIAVYKKNYALLDTVLKLGVDPNIPDWFGRTGFYKAVSSGDRKLIEMLKDVSNIAIPDKNGFTALHEAVFLGDLEAVECILACPVFDINATDRYGKSPLHIAAEKGYCEIFSKLIDSRADWMMITKRGDTFLHLAVRIKTEQMLCNKRLREQLKYRIRSRDPETYTYEGEMVLDSYLERFDNKNSQVIDRFNTIYRFAVKFDPDFVLRKWENKIGQYVSPAFTMKQNERFLEDKNRPHKKYRRKLKK